MRRIRVTEASGVLTCVALFRRDETDGDHRVAARLWNYDMPDEWWTGSNLYSLNQNWTYLFVFSDGSTGMAQTQQVEAALASCGLRLTEGGE